MGHLEENISKYQPMYNFSYSKNHILNPCSTLTHFLRMGAGHLREYAREWVSGEMLVHRMSDECCLVTKPLNREKTDKQGPRPAIGIQTRCRMI